MNKVSRRSLLAATASALAWGWSGRLMAAPPGSARFLLVFLRGGYDCANALVPYSSDFYYQSRPNIAIPRPAGAAADALALDADWALCPALRPALEPMWQSRQLAFVPFAGTDDLSRSHFETQDSIELGQPTASARNFQSGFMARLADTLGGAEVPAITFTDALPVCWRGRPATVNQSLRRIERPAFDERQTRILEQMYAGQSLAPAVTSGLAVRRDVSQALIAEMAQAGRSAVNTKGFALQAERMAVLMRDRYRIGFVDVGGWDTHVNEGGATGALATNLANLSEGLATFARTLGPEWRHTLVVVVSEFGRTFRENGDRGTDHGHGSVYWVLGGSIGGGRIAGEQRRVERAALLQDRDYPVLNDYRALLGGLFRSLWGLSEAQCARVFPAARAVDLKLI